MKNSGQLSLNHNEKENCMKKTLVIALITLGMMMIPSCNGPASPSAPDSYASFKANDRTVSWTFAWADTEKAGCISIHSGTKDEVTYNDLLNLNLVPKQTGVYGLDSANTYNMFFTYFIGPTTQDATGCYWSEKSSSFWGVEANITINKVENGIVEGIFNGILQLTNGTGIGDSVIITDGKFRARIRG
jgi:hypothetical protein